MQENDPNTVCVELRRELADELVEILEHEIQTAEEYHSTEQIFDEVTTQLRTALSKQTK
ncbi:hypothetical protein [Salinibaculum rarum]|uniref:hypothetical protein n=1 Tax=Salinibaculum rarum TaxID=3058903 RepID=UPI00265D9970|nr:hypothetical protein [Salinibaculum sp. KK48]